MSIFVNVIKTCVVLSLSFLLCNMGIKVVQLGLKVGIRIRLVFVSEHRMGIFF